MKKHEAHGACACVTTELWPRWLTMTFLHVSLPLVSRNSGGNSEGESVGCVAFDEFRESQRRLLSDKKSLLLNDATAHCHRGLCIILVPIVWPVFCNSCSLTVTTTLKPHDEIRIKGSVCSWLMHSFMYGDMDMLKEASDRYTCVSKCLPAALHHR